MRLLSSMNPENRFLPLALGISFAFHAMLLAIRFVAPETFQFRPADSGLEVILVNAKHDKAPKKADAIAQANLEGGGNADEGHAKSPLPDLQKVSDGDAIQLTQAKIEELERAQAEILSRAGAPIVAAPDAAQQSKRSTPQDGMDAQESQKVIARSVAEIANTIQDQNKRPRKFYITPSTRAEGYARYYKEMQKKIEDFGTLHFPQKEGKKLYGQLTLSIPIFQDGSIYTKEGGVTVDRSSGNPDLDKAALRIVQRSAPFGIFPPNMRSKDRDDVWVVVTRFTFTREQKLEAELRAN
ncbi:TonB family protein [Massilia sp. W12]|uniref:energy transducer TonB n=1 Tax=Massilia sp. W12 TaxID=3126507 RepID=UPI0030D54B89